MKIARKWPSHSGWRPLFLLNEGKNAVLIPKVGIFDGTSETLKKDMYVLVVDNKINRISSTPITAEPGSEIPLSC